MMIIDALAVLLTIIIAAIIISVIAITVVIVCGAIRVIKEQREEAKINAVDAKKADLETTGERDGNERP